MPEHLDRMNNPIRKGDIVLSYIGKSIEPFEVVKDDYGTYLQLKPFDKKLLNKYNNKTGDAVLRTGRKCYVLPTQDVVNMFMQQNQYVKPYSGAKNESNRKSNNKR